jgi:hypothetical protein
VYPRHIYMCDNVSLLHACIRLDAQARAHISTSHESTGYANRYAHARVCRRIVLSASRERCIVYPCHIHMIMRGQAMLHTCIRLDAQARAHVRTESTGYATRYVCAGVQTRSAQCFARALYSVSPPNENNYERSGATCVHTSGCTSARAHIHVPPIDGCTSAGRGRGGLHI